LARVIELPRPLVLGGSRISDRLAKFTAVPAKIHWYAADQLVLRDHDLDVSDRRSTIVVMRSTPLLLEAKPLDGYRVHVRVEDGTAGEVDLSYLLDYGGVFEPLRDPGYFRRLRADSEGGTIVWPNDGDIAPETLYAHAQRRASAIA
jgi:hypothetical protein